MLTCNMYSFCNITWINRCNSSYLWACISNILQIQLAQLWCHQRGGGCASGYCVNFFAFLADYQNYLFLGFVKKEQLILCHRKMFKLLCVVSSSMILNYYVFAKKIDKFLALTGIKLKISISGRWRNQKEFKPYSMA